MAYLLATIDNKVRWYVPAINGLEDIAKLQPGDFELLDVLDLARVPGFGNKDTAKRVAAALGLKTWRYVKLDSPQRTFTLT